jgi:release factor glutamine methyltransferase
MDKTVSLHEEITNRLAPRSDSPALDASVLLAHITQKPRTWVMAHADLTLTAGQQKHLEESLARLENGEPFPYVIGHWEFFGMDLEITPDVLIPRPETELMVEKALTWLQKDPSRRTVAEVGTGSGAIAIAIAMHVRDARILATDLSFSALKVAQRNSRKFNLENIHFVQCNLLPPHIDPLATESHFDLICANLPYIPTNTLQSLPIFNREPTLALDGGRDGFDTFRELLKVAPEWLAPNGLILLEIEATRGIQALNLASDQFSQAEIHLHQDFTGRDRLLEIQV